MVSRARGLLATLGGVALATALTVAPATAAAAASPDALVSSDGVTFSTEITGGIFQGLGLLVPGESSSASIWIKNVTPGTAGMRVSIAEIATSSLELSQSIAFSATDSSTGTTRTWNLADLAACDIVVPEQVIPVGGTVQLDFTIEMLDVAGSTAQGEIGDIEFMVAMRDDAAGPFPASSCSDVGTIVAANPPVTGRIAYTGYETPTNWLVLAGALVGFGILLVAKRRKKREDEA